MSARVPWRWFLPGPAILSTLFAVLVRQELWRSALIATRSGGARAVPAHVALVATLALSLLYTASLGAGARSFVEGARSPAASGAERGCALIFARALILIGLYGIGLRVWFWTAR